MSDTHKDNSIPSSANYVQQGRGVPVILIHGLAASLHDWDDLMPELAGRGYAAYAPDLLGHGDSPKPDSRAYRVDWVFEHFSSWVQSLELTEPPILIGHSLGGYVALEYARCVSGGIRGLVLVSPFYSNSQLPLLVRRAYARKKLSRLVVTRTPGWVFRAVVRMTSVTMGHSLGMLRSLPEKARQQTVLDYKRTAPGVYHIPTTTSDLSSHAHEVRVPALVVWGNRDKTLSPASFPRLARALPQARYEVLPAGHVPHQSHVQELNRIVTRFLQGL